MTRSGNVAIWEMNGTTVLNPATSFVANVANNWSVFGNGDYNGDGKSDILWHDGSGNVAIWEMNGTTVLNPATSFVANVSGTWAIAGTGDFNGDGKSDILWHDGSGNVAIWEMNGTTVLNPATSFVANVPGTWSIFGSGRLQRDRQERHRVARRQRQCRDLGNIDMPRRACRLPSPRVPSYT